MKKTFILALAIAAVSFGCAEEEKEVTHDITSEVIVPDTNEQVEYNVETITAEGNKVNANEVNDATDANEVEAPAAVE